MIHIITKTSNMSCRNAIQWLNENEIPYVEKKMNKEKITKDEILHILKLSENGFDSILSLRSAQIQTVLRSLTKKAKGAALTTDEMINAIIEHPNIMKYPIIYDDRKLLVGYNSEEITMFVPPEIRQQQMANIIGSNYTHNGGCKKPYLKSISAETIANFRL